MKILSINLFYKEGSTGKIVAELHKGLLRNGHESWVCHGLGTHTEENLFKFSSEFSWKFYTYLSALSGKQYTYSFLETKKLLSQIDKVRPDLVHVHVINCNTVNVYRLLDFLKYNNYKTIITFHAEFLYTGGCSHAFGCMKWKTGCGNCPRLWEATHSLVFDRTAYAWKRFKGIYSGFEKNLKIACVSEWLRDRAIQSPFFTKTDISVIDNGIDTKNTFFPQHSEELSVKFKGDNKTVLLHVTPSFRSKIKGGEYIIRLAERLDKNQYKIIIVGYDDNLNLPSNVIPIKNVYDQKLLAQYYSLADMTIITSKVETYSMVCAESLACGTPVIGFKCGAPEQIALKDYSLFVENGDLDELERAVHQWKDKKESVSKTLFSIANTHYSIEKMVDKYMDLYKSHI
jgi:putative colanic acid biosynthesis glycosyltransferase